MSQRAPSWASDFPSAGDRVIAQILNQSGLPEGDDRRYGHRLVIERSSAQVVGGVGLFGRPVCRVVEVGYGIVPSRQRRGYTTEAVRAVVADIFDRGAADTVRAGVDVDNPASIRVLEKSAFQAIAQNGTEATYETHRTDR